MLFICLCRRHRIGQLHRKAEGGHTALAGNGNILFVLVKNGLDHIQTQSVAVLIHTAGLVRLMEPLEQQGQFLGGNGIAEVAHREVGLPLGSAHTQIQRRALTGKLGGVFQQIIDHLGDIILVCKGKNGMFRHIHFYVDTFLQDLLPRLRLEPSPHQEYAFCL